MCVTVDHLIVIFLIELFSLYSCLYPLHLLHIPNNNPLLESGIQDTPFICYDTGVKSCEVEYGQNLLCCDTGIKSWEVWDGTQGTLFYAVIQGPRVVKWDTGHNMLML